ncbi:MAG: hypothetical protein IJW21_00160 [Clostridia bacterium]|nr:hypothetical protein [Clostridia bacterium]
MNIKTKKTFLKIYLAAALAAGAGFAVWRTLLLKRFCNPSDMSFEDGALPTLRVFEYALLAACVLLATCVFFAGKTRFGLFGARISTTSVTVCAVCGFMLATVGVLAFIYHSDTILDFSDKSVMGYRIFYLAALGSMFIGALYFLGRASIVLKNSSSLAALSLSLPIFCIAHLVASYFNSELPLLDFNRVTSEIAFIAVLMFVLTEASLSTGGKNYAWRFASSLICIVCVCAYIVPLLILVAFWEMRLSLSLLTEISLMGILLYALFAAFNAIRTLEETPKEEEKT